MSDDRPAAVTASDPSGMALVPRARLEELVAAEVAYQEEHASETRPPSLAARFGRFCAGLAKQDEERRG